jgi:hypothetical protein
VFARRRCDERPAVVGVRRLRVEKDAELAADTADVLGGRGAVEVAAGQVAGAGEEPGRERRPGGERELAGEPEGRRTGGDRADPEADGDPEPAAVKSDRVPTAT